MVKKLYQLQLQATVLVLLAFAAPSKGDAIELYNWMNNKTLETYWNNFTIKFGIPYVTYRTINGYNFFYGLFVDRSTTWTFALKDLASGKIQHQISCSEVTNSCGVKY